jgi:hypothetical protein
MENHMTDETNDHVPSDNTQGVNVDRETRLQNLLQSRAVGFNSASVPASVEPKHTSVSYSSATDTLVIHGDQGSTEVPASELPPITLDNIGPVHDDGRNVDATYKTLSNKWDDYNARLEACHYDPVTGAKIYNVQGSQREQLLREFKQFDESMRYECVVLVKLKLQRQQAEIAQVQAFEDAAAVEKALDDRAAEIAFETEARRRAEGIIARNRSKG